MIHASFHNWWNHGKIVKYKFNKLIAIQDKVIKYTNNKTSVTAKFALSICTYSNKE